MATYNSFEELGNSGIEFQKRIETVEYEDENVANNRLFVWQFERADLEEFVRMFEIYKGRPINGNSRQELNGSLSKKMNTLITEGYIPIECMLYASKVINMKLSNDVQLIKVLAERIRDVYLRQSDKTVKVLNNILDTWTWIPQLKVAIVAVGLIGDNEELLDKIYFNFVNDEQLRSHTFHAFLENKNAKNLERAMKVVMNFNDGDETDEKLSRIFIKEFNNFGSAGVEILEKYGDNPGMSRLAKQTLMKNKLNIGIDPGTKDTFSLLAKESRDDDKAYEKFVELCLQRNDEDAGFLSRFSRVEIIDVFLEKFLKDDTQSQKSRNSALISLGQLGSRGNTRAKEILQEFQNDPASHYAYLLAMILLKDGNATKEFVNMFGQKPESELHNLYALLRNAALYGNPEALRVFQNELHNHLCELVAQRNLQQLSNYVGNLQIFWDKGLFFLLSNYCLNEISSILTKYVQGDLNLDDDTVISLLEIHMHRYSVSFEGILFAIYENAQKTQNTKIRSYIFKKLKERDIQPPK